jgi:CheY-like chemotaxis protein
VTTPDPAPATLDLFYSYSHRDEDLRDELAKHLALLERRKIIRSWHDRKISAGEVWADKIDENLEVADIVLLLVSSDFIASDYCYEKEMKRALERHARGTACTIPVIIRPCDWHDSDFGRLQVLPKDGKAVASWPMRDEAWTDVAKGIRKVAADLSARGGSPPPPPTVASQPSPTRTQGATRSAALDEAAASGAGSDPHFERALEEFQERVAGAILERANEVDGADAVPVVDRSELSRMATGLASISSAKRILWVDDRPAGNLREREALLGMQIEVVTALSTDEGLKRLRDDRETFDLIISDWRREPQEHLLLPEGLRLARELRKVAKAPPLVFYHGVMGGAAAGALRLLATQAGALGATARPDELLWLVMKAIA